MASSSTPTNPAKPPVTIITVGCAGSGKTTFMQRMASHLHSSSQPPYILNLDPAVHSTPFSPNIDIRDSVNYKEVMKQYNLGPNGGILTSLNLFATKIDQVLSILEKRCLPSQQPPNSPPVPAHILLDTPGQIEVFVWSASGSILLSALASSFPTVLAYVIDTPRTTSSTSTFMSNMLYAISILYKTRLPMILVFNKTDVKKPDEAIEWMRDFEAFQAALRKEEEADDGTGGTGYVGSLLNSMSLVLEEFYNNLSVVGVSSTTGQGMDEFFAAVEGKRGEFEREYAPELQRRREEREREKEANREKQVEKLMRDMGVEERRAGQGQGKEEAETVSEAEDESDDDDGEGEGGSEDRGETGLKARYEQALKDKSGVSAEDASFAKYVQMAGINR
ncbi:ATP binding protein [Elsinoe ampelina]|uniref:GPN-loop GTPase n=1 Tax=Elsinoe ampelina TaxID=302913 RepID=A0A6A6G6H0_9PEZI|nr:ATP binding protein [Elsinoe ampelina]